MREYKLKYGCNPNQKPARLTMPDGGELPFRVLNGNPGYINFLDAFNAWQLVGELAGALRAPAAASFKHVSPTSAALGRVLPETLKKACFVDDLPGLDDSPMACAYARARGADRLCSYGDFAALSDVCDETTAKLLAREVSDGVVAPGYTSAAFALLKQKRRGGYNIIAIDSDYRPRAMESREVFGVRFEQSRNDAPLDGRRLENIVTRNKVLPDDARRDLVVSLITLKYTQSNSVCFALDGQAIGVGAGQQSRVHCTRLAAGKADAWFLREHEKTLALPFLPELSRPERDNAVDKYLRAGEDAEFLADGWRRCFRARPEPLTELEKREFLSRQQGASLGSDAFFPFADSVERAFESGARYIAQPGGSLRDVDVIAACDRVGAVMAFTGVRLFHH